MTAVKGVMALCRFRAGAAELANCRGAQIVAAPLLKIGTERQQVGLATMAGDDMMPKANRFSIFPSPTMSTKVRIASHLIGCKIGDVLYPACKHFASTLPQER